MTDFRPSESSGPKRILHSHGGKGCRLRAVGCVTSTVLGMAVWLGLLPAPVLAAVRLEVGQASGYPGWVVDLPVTLAIEGEAPSSVGHTLFFPDPRSVKVQRRSDGEPDCTPAAGVATPGRFAFWPVGCVYEEDECDAVTALFVDLSGTLPNLPAGPLFSCKVGISTAAVPGTYPVQNVDPESSARRGRALSTTGTDGAVQVLQPPGGGGCAVMPERGSAAWWLAMLLAVVLYRGLRAGRCQRAFVGSRHTWIGAMLLFMAVVLLRGGALAQATEVYVEGRWYGHGKEGTWAGELVVAENGSVSGQVRFAGLEALPAANVLAVWSAGGLRQGSLFRSGGAVRAGRLRGSWGAAGVAGEFTVADGSLFAWELRTVRAKREKAAPPRASALLARGQPATVVVGLDIYPAVREGRARTNALVHRRWDNRAAVEAFYGKLAEIRAAFVAYARQHPDLPVVEDLPWSTSVTVRVNTREGLAHLLAAKHVRVVDDERMYRVALGESLPLIGQPSASRLGLNGRGVAIGVIDTGVDHLLRDASGRLVFGEGCLDGVGAPGCVIRCAVTHANGYWGRRDEPTLHGTTVSGVASSVAPDAGLCVSDVWDEVAAASGDPAITRPNIAAALDWFVDLEVRGVHNIRVLNMSLGAVPNVFLPNAPPAYCSDIELQSEIFSLLYLDVAIVAATGNGGRTNWVDIPSCMRGVIRVGATYDESFTGRMDWWNTCSDVNPWVDSIACFSNGWSLPLVLAPGALIRFADRAPAAGTSLAAPHVAGAIAALRGEGPFAPDDTECITARLIKTGTPVFDARPNINRAFPRIDLGAAAATLPNSTGDCNANGRVGTTDIELGVAIALGEVGIAQCPLFDARQDGQVTIDELVAAVNVSLYGCTVGPSGYA